MWLTRNTIRLLSKIGSSHVWLISITLIHSCSGSPNSDSCWVSVILIAQVIVWVLLLHSCCENILGLIQDVLWCRFLIRSSTWCFIGGSWNFRCYTWWASTLLMERSWVLVWWVIANVPSIFKILVTNNLWIRDLLISLEYLLLLLLFIVIKNLFQSLNFFWSEF